MLELEELGLVDVEDYQIDSLGKALCLGTAFEMGEAD